MHASSTRAASKPRPTAAQSALARLGFLLLASLLAACREIRPTVGEGAVTRLPGLLVARYLGPSGEPARAWFVALWAALRPALVGRAASVPRIWHT